MKNDESFSNNIQFRKNIKENKLKQIFKLNWIASYGKLEMI